MPNNDQLDDLSIVVPVYNGSQWLRQFLNTLAERLSECGLMNAPIYIINDGSTDTTQEILENHIGLSLKIINQPNSGRLSARIRGLSEVKTPFCLLIDVKVTLDESSLIFALEQLRSQPNTCWTAHVEYAVVNWSSVVWIVLEKFLWRRYWKEPKLVVFAGQDFDEYPKGTTALIGHTKILFNAMTEYVPTVSNAAHASDDTAILRSIAATYGIHLSPNYSCTYHPRNSSKQFVQHVFNRGIFLVDGHFNKTSGVFRKILKLAAVTGLIAVVSLKFPLMLWLSILGFLITVLATNRVTDIPFRKRLVLLVMLIPFTLLYLSGVLAGIFYRFKR